MSQRDISEMMLSAKLKTGGVNTSNGQKNVEQQKVQYSGRSVRQAGYGQGLEV